MVFHPIYIRILAGWTVSGNPGDWQIEDKIRFSIACHGQLSGGQNGNGYPIAAFFFPASFVGTYVRILVE